MFFLSSFFLSYLFRHIYDQKCFICARIELATIQHRDSYPTHKTKRFVEKYLIITISINLNTHPVTSKYTLLHVTKRIFEKYLTMSILINLRTRPITLNTVCIFDKSVSGFWTIRKYFVRSLKCIQVLTSHCALNFARNSFQASGRWGMSINLFDSNAMVLKRSVVGNGRACLQIRRYLTQ